MSILPFNRPRQTCLRHLTAMQNYPKLTKETPETLENLIDTTKTISAHWRTQVTLCRQTPLSSDYSCPDTIQQWELNLGNRHGPTYWTRSKDGLTLSGTILKHPTHQRRTITSSHCRSTKSFLRLGRLKQLRWSDWSLSTADSNVTNHLKPSIGRSFKNTSNWDTWPGS